MLHAEAPTTDEPASISDDLGSFAHAWDTLDLEEVRRIMPNNLVWQLTMPTKDPSVLDKRREIRQYWENQYGKVLSNTATVKEVNEYYAHQQQRSADYIEFTSYILDNHGSELREQDANLLQIARTLHMARIEEIPRHQAEALARREAHAKAREAWKADQKRFEGEAPQDRETE